MSESTKMLTLEEIQKNLTEHGIAFNNAPAPAAAYLPFTLVDGVVYTAGQIATKDGEFVHTGIVGRDLNLEEAQACAHQCAINVLAQLNVATDGDLSKIKKITKLNVFVASAPDFTEQHLVANAASHLIANVLGDAGRHARSAIGVAVLPLNSPVEIEAIAILKD